MPERTRKTQLVDIIEPLLRHSEDIPVSNIVHKWESEMHTMISDIFSQGGFDPEVEKQYYCGIGEWVKHPDHGAQHSAHVYLGARYMMSEEGEWKNDPLQDTQLQIEAVAHDIFQIFPYLNPKTGEVLVTDSRIQHPELSARAILAIAAILNIDSRTVAIDIRHHDDTYFGRIFNRFSPIGKYVAYADKLFGATCDQRDPKALVKSAIDRNRQGVSKSIGEVTPDSWYFLRDDLTHPWQYGDRWYGDRLSALRTDFVESRFYTEIGQRIGEERRKAFIEIAPEEFAKEYDAVMQIMNQWEETSNSGNNSIELVGKNQRPIPMDGHNITTIISLAYESQLPLSVKPDKSHPKGYMVVLKSHDKSFVIDPSIARFKTKDDFLEAISKRLN